MVMRIIGLKIRTLEELKLPEVLRTITLALRGLTLLTGTTGSGKSTTLAAMIDLINRTYRCKIITIEDPIEYMHTNQKAMIAQLELGQDTPSFEQGLQAGAAAGPGRDPGGRAARQREHADGAAGRGHRPPGLRDGAQHEFSPDDRANPGDGSPRGTIDRHFATGRAHSRRSSRSGWPSRGTATAGRRWRSSAAGR